ncbi:MAG TPA: PEP-CTERM sorting domain-containing protein [Vicinamibacterales bacterium]|nr:PEP-CTERM sorting domain-containing protein [Vicinamibacterales bacterium]
MIDLTKKVAVTAVAAAFALVGTSNAAYASDIAFDFNSLSTGAHLTGANSVQTYMNTILAGNGGGTVVLSGGGLNGNSLIVTNSYDGEGHVYGPGGVAVTLGTTDHGVAHGGPNDNFLYTFTGTSIIMQFSGLAPVHGVTFDFEIFPNNECSNVNNPNQCSSVPDFTFKFNGVTVPGGHFLASNPPAGSRSALSNPETNPQMPPMFFSYTFASSMSAFTLEFDDWPATIGVDNVTLVRSPEPGSMILLGSGLAGFLARRRTKAAR